MLSLNREKQLLNRIDSIDLFYENALDQSEYILPPILFLNALFFHTASLMGYVNLKAIRTTNRGDKTIIPNHYAISLAGQGVGKDHAFKICKRMYDKPYNNFIDRVGLFYDKMNTEEPDRRYIRISDYFIDVSSSEQGIQKAAQTIKDFGHGSVNCTSDELADVIGQMDPIFKKLKTAWDDGMSYGPLNVSDGGANYFTVENITYNAMLYGSPEVFSLRSELKDKLIHAYVSGMTRRTFIYHNIWYRKSEMKNENYETMLPEKIKQVDKYIQDIFHFIKETDHILIPQQIYNKLRKYDEEKQVEREKLRDKTPIAESLGSIKKIEKLLPIIATLDLSEKVLDEHLDFAILFTELVDSTTLSTVEYKSNHILLYETLEKKTWTTRSELVKSIKGLTLKTLEEEMILVEEYAYRLGNSLIKKEYGKMISYKLEKLSESTDNLVIISVNTNMANTQPAGFVKKRGNFFNMHKIINSEVRYSAGSFRDEYINDANYMQEQNMIVLDIDDGMTIDEAKSLLSQYTYLMTTTKSHQKDKHGEICDRFRIFLPTVSIFHLEPDAYKRMYDNFAKALGLYSYDEKCKNPSRWYYGVDKAKHWYNKGELIDIRSFIPDSTEQLQARQAINNYENDSSDYESRIDGAIRWFLQSTTQGNRNDNLFKFAMLLKTVIESSDWENITMRVNYMLSQPLSDHDIKTIIRSAQRR